MKNLPNKPDNLRAERLEKWNQHLLDKVRNAEIKAAEIAFENERLYKENERLRKRLREANGTDADKHDN